MSTRVSGDDLLRLRPDRPANGGEAVARLDDRVVFVRDAIPGELVTARITDDRGRFLRAETVDVLEPSPHRVTPACGAVVHGAGCCDLAFIGDGHARALKGQVLGEALTRIGGFTPADLDALGVGADVVRPLGARSAADGADTETGWRIRARLGVDRAGRAGLFARGGPDIIWGHGCAALDPLLRDVVGSDGHRPGTELVLVVDEDGGRQITELAPPPDLQRARRGDARGRAQARRRSREAPRTRRVVEGADDAVHRVGRRAWRIPVTGFWQAHRQAPATYSRTVTDMIEAAGLPAGRGRVAWDLYGGAGVFAAALLDGPMPDATVHLVETDREAMAAAATTFGDERVTGHRGDVASTIGDLPAPDVVVLDPPRTGAGRDVVAAVAAADPEVVVHVGCDVGRFARDLGAFRDEGYEVRELRAFDAFPQTHHVEAIACLVPAHRFR